MGSSKSRSKKTGATAGSTRKPKQTQAADENSSSAGAVALVDPPAAAEHADQVPAPAAADTETKPVSARRRSSRAASSATAAKSSATPRKRGRKASETPAPEPAPEPLTESVADIAADAPIHPPVEAVAEPAAETVAEPAAEPVAEAAIEPAAASALETMDLFPAPRTTSDADEAEEKPVELPFIIDIPREVPVEDDAPAAAADEWVDQILEPAPRTPKQTDEWVDQVLEPTKPSVPPRPRVRAEAPRTAVAKSPAAKTPAAKSPAAKSSAAAPVAAKASADTAQVTRWWLVAPVLLVLAVLLFANRPGKSHAPVPEGVLGTWTTAFWLYEHQTLEIKPDTVVATLDDTNEGRFPITKVETTDLGRETAVKISYRNGTGDEKVLDFTADKDPTTALRFRSHSGLVWVRADE